MLGNVSGNVSRSARSLWVRLASLRLGARAQAAARTPGLWQRWYVAQPTQRIVIALLELDDPPTSEALEQAFRSLCAHHPDSLGVCVERSLQRVQLRPLTAAEPVPWQAHDADPWTVAASLAHLPFGPGAPLFRAASTSSENTVVLAFDHVAFDGVSAALCARELAKALAGETLDTAPAEASLPLDARLDLRPSLGQLVRAITARPVPPWLPIPPLSAAPLLRTSLLCCALTAEQTERLHRCSRAHGVTVQGALAAAGLLAANEVLGRSPDGLVIETPISLRDRCLPRPSGHGVFIAGTSARFVMQPPPAFWTLAAGYLAELARERVHAEGRVGLLALAGDLRGRAQRMGERAHGRTATLEVSNVGRVQAVPEGARIWLTQGAHYHGPLFVLTVATCDSDGVLRCCLSFPSPLVSQRLAEDFMACVQRQLREASP